MPDTYPRPALSRYRPVLYLLSGVAAAYAIVYIHNHLFSSSTSTSQTSLRRRRAVRRQRRRGEAEPANAAAADTPSSRAIAHLEQLERQNGVYGTFRIETEDGRRVESGLLPSLLATRDQLMEEVGVPQDHAERMREMMEDTFLESFLALDFPPTHTLEEGTPERDYLIEQLQRRGISRAGIERALELRRRRQNGERSPPAQNMDGGETVVDDQSVFSWRDGQNDASPTREGQNLLNLLYHIAEDQARRDGCGAMPIQGIRYRCANCIDYDLCETCEAMGVHIKTHLFYKVRIPAPFLGNPRQSQPVCLSRSLAKRLMKETGFENTELDALWDQFRCLANHEWEDDPNKLYMAIDRKTFDRCFVPNTSIRPPPPSLIYDRMFAFYDTNSDGLIGFEEFLKGIASLNNKSNDERLRRVFRGYDIDGDGYIERKDFLRVFRAYYALSRELTRDMVAGMEDDFLEGGARDVVLGSQPISSAFPGSIPSGEASRTGEGKRVNPDGDMEIVDNESIVRPDRADTADRHSVVGDAAVRSLYGSVRPMFPTAARLETPSGSGVAHASGSNTRRDVNGEDASNPPDDASNSSGGSDRWPPPEGHVRDRDIVDALGSYVPLNEITDPADRDRVGAAVYNRMYEQGQLRVRMTRSAGIRSRWQRRRFYTDEEDGATVPHGYHSDMDVDGLTEDEDDEEVDEPQPESHPPSPRSRSSSKVRFQDDLTDDYDVRSNPSTSSRSILVGERWGGFEIPEVERDVGKEILYQVTQQGFNELLDLLFKPKEDLLMEAFRSRADRKMWAHEIERVEQMESGTQVGPEDRRSTDEADEPPESSMVNPLRDRPLDELLSRAGYSVRSPPLEPVLPPPTPDLALPNDDVVYLGVPDEVEAEEAVAILAPSADHDHDLLRRMMSPMLPNSPSSHASTFEEDDESLPPSVSSYYDPTLPHHRPNDDECDETREDPEPILSSPPSSTHLAFDDDPPQSPQLPAELRLEPNGTTSFPAPASPSISSPEAEATAPKLSPSPIQPLPSSPTLPRRASPPRPPSKAQLAHLAYLEKIEQPPPQQPQ
ncbi:hypothetical protein BO78DRAFT_461716 [Aspergillus sclerotiicarbonarius CBS 121057]|uniref:EF hand domain protein n=1 Tax=Aspergillus sclerotiicarbonarius (strain CBS 121057 / IBT 28362) TaxID=1448318 RepID=A0A319EPY1_ASPSB|nr:hypothetical protein BO78DRAFT_461716 [Aspergillus sclerotiicarbonarius CBS 121057]